MAAHAGERLGKAEYFTAKNATKRFASKGATIPKCRNCGGATYDERTEETSGR
jgi:hypothetical protein